MVPAKVAVTGLLLATSFAVLVATGGNARASAALVAAAPCGGLAASYDPVAPPAYDQVVVIMEENLSYSHWLSTTHAPYAHGLAASCGAETNFHAATHPSQPNYMAATSGVATPVGRMTANDNVFHQLQAAGRTWRNYAENMPAHCVGTVTTKFKPGHTPAYWYTDLRTPVNTCKQFDVPLSPALDNAISTDKLPAYTWITPSLCHNFEWKKGCPTPDAQRIVEGDRWLSTMIPRLTAMPSYQAGRTIIFVTWDEGEGGPAGIDCADPATYGVHPDCAIATFVVSPYIVPGAQDGTDLNLYALLGTTQDLLGLPRLGRAGGQPSLRTGLGF